MCGGALTLYLVIGSFCSKNGFRNQFYQNCCAEFEIIRENINAKNKTTDLRGSPINWLRPRGREGAVLLWRGKNRITK